MASSCLFYGTLMENIISEIKTGALNEILIKTVIEINNANIEIKIFWKNRVARKHTAK